jgi:hypothetical protein
MATEERAQIYMPFSSALVWARAQHQKENTRQESAAQAPPPNTHWDKRDIHSEPTRHYANSPKPKKSAEGPAPKAVLDQAKTGNKHKASPKLGNQRPPKNVHMVAMDNSICEINEENFPTLKKKPNDDKISEVTREDKCPTKNRIPEVSPPHGIVRASEGERGQLDMFIEVNRVMAAVKDDSVLAGGGYPVLLALAKWRVDGNADRFLRTICYPNEPPKRSQLLELVMMAAGLISCKSPDFDNLPAL